jgi:membrane fusion protein (multidrug efflux system)
MRRSSVLAGVSLFVGLAVVAGGLAAYKMRRGEPAAPGGGGGGFEPAESVQLIEAREVNWQPEADLVGTVIAIRSVLVRNEIAGRATFVGFDSGSTVEEGQVLLRQDDTTAKADLDAAKAKVRVAEASVAESDSQITLAEVEFERLSKVQARAVAEVELDRAKSKLDTARAGHTRWQAEVDQSKAQVAQLEARLAKLTMTAPFRARAGMRSVHEGQYLAEGADVVALQELTDKIYLDFAIPQEYAPRVSIGTTVMATAELLGRDPFPIKVVAVDATVNNDTRNLRVRAIVNNPGGTLVPGMFVPVRVPIDATKAFVAIPSMAVRRAAYANSVFVVTPDEHGDKRVHQRFIALGQTIGENVIVLEGLKAGEMVAGAGSFKLRDGAKLMPQAPAAPGGAPTGGGSESAAAGK